MIDVPPALVVDLVRAQGEAGRAWARELPGRVEALCDRWRLRPDDQRVRHGANAVVVAVHRRDGPAALKVTWHIPSARDEAAALTAWAGRGAVRLLDASPDDGALLLERLDASRTLADVPLHAAVPAVAGVLRRLSGPDAPAAADDVPRACALAASVAAGLEVRQRALGEPVPTPWLIEARSAATDLADDDARRLVHADLHWGNVLAGAREPWLAIDPRPRSGSPELSLPELLWTRVDELADDVAVRALLADLVAAAHLDVGRARAWVVVRTVDYWLWGLEHGLTIDPGRCRRVLAAVL